MLRVRGKYIGTYINRTDQVVTENFERNFLFYNEWLVVINFIIENLCVRYTFHPHNCPYTNIFRLTTEFKIF